MKLAYNMDSRCEIHDIKFKKENYPNGCPICLTDKFNEVNSQENPITRAEGVKTGMKPTKLTAPKELEVVTQSPDAHSTSDAPKEYEDLKFYHIGDETIDGWLDKANERIKVALKSTKNGIDSLQTRSKRFITAEGLGSVSNGSTPSSGDIHSKNKELIDKDYEKSLDI